MAFLPFSTVFFRHEKFVILYYTILEPSCHPFSENVRRPEGSFTPTAGDRGWKDVPVVAFVSYAGCKCEGNRSERLCLMCELQIRGNSFRASLINMRVANPRKDASVVLIDMRFARGQEQASAAERFEVRKA
ncbi:MAG: hypothetical protein C6P37_07205 [Caldibacillus debilis]|uniref:Uncharacterized protein n=2 Tax=Caldibacillus debilis TaxID=301148 RepID=A0A3E0K689_9BACI|nr:MAG: hypothetical protein C6W57_11470 [Caldibacillus debilis]REJ29022.1 MAG: hypothetical protein C6P37_07205 [Caldibacillus debilis]